MLELDARTLTHEQFCDLCLKGNLPAIIRHAAGEGSDNEKKKIFFFFDRMKAQLSPEGLIDTFGWSYRVPTTEFIPDLLSGSGDEYIQCQNMSLREVFECWRGCKRMLYLKDWNMQLECESRAKFLKLPESAGKVERDGCECAILHGDGLYGVPDYLGDDWMNEFCCKARDEESGLCHFGDKKNDYRFAYIGPPSTWTPLHFDVFGTYSWSLNVCGEKLWFFPSPEGNFRLMENTLQGLMLPMDIRTLTDTELWTVVQQPGDLVFVPSVYLHQVHNVSGQLFALPRTDAELTTNAFTADNKLGSCAENDTVSLVISINHNWCNKWCVGKIVEIFCRDAYRLLRLLTKDDRVALFGDNVELWHSHMERMLISGTNWNFSSVCSFLKYRVTFLDSRNEIDGEERAMLLQLLGKIDAAKLYATDFC